MAGPTLETFIGFTAAGLGVLLYPGPAVMYITALGLREGRRTTTAAAVGLGVGNLTHVLAATVGLSALLASSDMAYNILKYIGAVYLIYLGVHTLRTRHALELASVTVRHTSARRELRRGFVVNTLNPKVAFFFLAFVPHFVAPDRGSVALQFFLLGVWFAVLGTVTDALYGVAAGGLGDWLRHRRAFQRPIQLMSGSVYIFLGVLAVGWSLDL